MTRRRGWRTMIAMRRRAVVVGVIGGLLFGGAYVGVRVGAPRRVESLARRFAVCLRAEEEKRTAMEPLRVCAADVRASLRLVGALPGLSGRRDQLARAIELRLAERELRHASSTVPDPARRATFARSVHALAGGSLGFEPDWLPAPSFDLATPAANERDRAYKVRAAFFLADVGAIDRLLVDDARFRCARGDVVEGRRLYREAMGRRVAIDLPWAAWCGVADDALRAYDPLGHSSIDLPSKDPAPVLPGPNLDEVLAWAAPAGPNGALPYEDVLVGPTRFELEPSPAAVGAHLERRPTPTDFARYRFAAAAADVHRLAEEKSVSEADRARLRRLEWVFRLGAATTAFRTDGPSVALGALAAAEAIAPADRPSVAVWFRLALGDAPTAVQRAEAASAGATFATLPVAERALVHLFHVRALSRRARWDEAYALAKSVDQRLGEEVGAARQVGEWRPLYALAWTRVALAVRTGHEAEAEPPYLAAQAELLPPGHRGVPPYRALASLLSLRGLSGEARAEARAHLALPPGALDGYILYLLGSVADGAPEVLLDWLLRGARPTVGFAWLRAEAARLRGDEAARVSWSARADRLFALPPSPF